MALSQTILDLSDRESNNVIKLLVPLDARVSQRVDYVMSDKGLSKQQALEFVVTSNPILWAKVYLDWTARKYQYPIVSEGKRAKKLVLRLGRRLGKTDCMCVLILWYAYTQYNKGENDQYDILIITPYDSQVDLIFKRIHQLSDKSPLLSSLITRDIHHHMEITVNGMVSSIQGFTGGAQNSSSGGNATRGQRADVLFFDEVDYLGSSQLTAILNIRNEAPERIKLIAASTPSGRHDEYYKWCMGATKKYFPSKQDIEANTFTKYMLTKKKPGQGNGFVEIYAPSNVNKELLKFNPDTMQTYLEDMKDELSEIRYAQEVMAEFGDAELGVYQTKYINAALAEGERINHTYITDWEPEDRAKYLRKTQGQCFRILGVDWDKVQAGTTFVCMEYDRFHQDANNTVVPVFRVLFRLEISRGEFTFTNAMNKIIALNDEYKFDWIGVDRGYGDTQIEQLKKYGMEHPETHLHEKLIGYHFKENIEVTDPWTRKKSKQMMKPFMVNNSVSLFEKGKIILNPKDRLMKEQLTEYHIERIAADGHPIYTSVNEHAIDAMNIALLMFEQKYGTLLKKVYSIKTAPINIALDNRDMDVTSREFDPIESVLAVAKIPAPSSTNGVVGITNMRGRASTMPKVFERAIW